MWVVKAKEIERRAVKKIRQAKEEIIGHGTVRHGHAKQCKLGELGSTRQEKGSTR